MELNAKALNWIADHTRFALLTLITIKGASPRPIGAQMLVSENREVLGQISSGCVEQNLIELAMQALESSGDQQFEVGAQGPYLDLQLPCGSSLTVLCQTTFEASIFSDARQYIESRIAYYLCFDGDRLFYRTEPSHFTIATRHPSARAVVVGRPNDPQVTLLKSLLAAVGIELIDRLENVDQYTAFVSLWHDAEQELPPLLEALQCDLFYIGCIGSRASHAERVIHLKRAGATTAQINQIYAPAGATLMSKTPGHVALAIAHELVSQYEHYCTAQQNRSILPIQ
ncbi:MAG: XdhC family protein [Gammaproteobacteria bacterium]|nr:XdhC family protein [Gammaproteobacteria bacterium]